MMAKTKANKFLLVIIIGIIIAIFLAGFGIVYAIKLPFHSTTQPQLGGRFSAINHPTISGAMSIYFIDPSGRRVPIGNSVMDIVFTYNGKQVKYVAGDVTLRVSGKTGDQFTYRIDIYFSVEKESSSSNSGSSGGGNVQPPARPRGIQPQSIVPLQLVPGTSSTGSTDDYKLELTGTATLNSSTVTITRSFKVEIAQLIQGAQAGDKYHITIYAEAYVEDTSNGSHDHAVSDAVSFDVSVNNTSSNSEENTTSAISISDIKINPVPK